MISYLSREAKTRIRPLRMVLGLHISRHSATDLMTLVLKSSNTQLRWSVSSGVLEQIGQGIFGGRSLFLLRTNPFWLIPKVLTEELGNPCAAADLGGRRTDNGAANLHSRNGHTSLLDVLVSTGLYETLEALLLSLSGSGGTSSAKGKFTIKVLTSVRGRTKSVRRHSAGYE